MYQLKNYIHLWSFSSLKNQVLNKSVGSSTCVIVYKMAYICVENMQAKNSTFSGER